MMFRCLEKVGEGVEERERVLVLYAQVFAGIAPRALVSTALRSCRADISFRFSFLGFANETPIVMRHTHRLHDRGSATCFGV